jgi:hypothetical protein
MRKYLKPAMEMEAFDVEDIITVSVPEMMDDDASAPADLDIDFN